MIEDSRCPACGKHTFRAEGCTRINCPGRKRVTAAPPREDAAHEKDASGCYRSKPTNEE